MNDDGPPPGFLKDNDDTDAARGSLTDLIDGLERASFMRALETRDARLADVSPTDERGYGSLNPRRGHPPAA